ncbi:MAG TPA: aconitate hydratase [Mesorhizobium sp.]|jgi:aconitate hydratase|nr:aconitate hydratase [Mesorhizobium sp.]
MAKPQTLAQKLIASHLVGGRMEAGEEIALRVDQVLLQDATGTLTMLALEAMGLDRVKVTTAAQYVDHNLLQTDYKNPDDHLFLQSAARRFGIWYSPPGNGISHPVHMERFGKPGDLLVGSDSHTCAAGSMGMLALGAGSIEVAAVLAGEPINIRMPEVWGVRLSGALPDWVSAKDVILGMLRRHTVDGGLGRIIEYHGPGTATLSAMDRHVIANMGAELGATTSVFASDEETRRFLELQGRGSDWVPLSADPGAVYDVEDEIDLSRLVPLIALPSSPDKVVPVSEAAGAPVYQAYLGSSANPGYRDFAVCAHMVKGRAIAPGVSFDINPSTRQILATLSREGLLNDLLLAGARLHQAGCNGCMGMGQAPASGRNSLRTTPRNFKGRSGNREDSVFLCSPETATASALTGVITDPRTLGIPYRRGAEPPSYVRGAFLAPPLKDAAEARAVSLTKGPNIASLPPIEPIADRIEAPVLLKLGDDVSTDTISPAGARGMQFRSNVQKIAELSFDIVDPTYPARARACGETGHVIVVGENYGQGSSREHAVLAPRYLGLSVVVAKSFARIQWQNLVNAGILPLTFVDPDDYERIEQGDTIRIEQVRKRIAQNERLFLALPGGRSVAVRHSLSPRQLEIVLVGGLINWLQRKPPTNPTRIQQDGRHDAAA